MVDNEEETQKKRITVGLDDFDYMVVSKMSTNRKSSRSEIIRSIVHQWVEYNPDLLKENYMIDLKEVTEELTRGGPEISLDKTLKPFEKDIIKEFPDFFEIVETISIEDLADHFQVDVKAVKRIIFTHGKEIKKLGLNLVLKNNEIVKITD